MVAAVLLQLSGLVEPLERATHDFVSRLLAPAMTDTVSLVVIDEESLAAFGRWPWSRALQAQLVRRISEAGPAAIGLDIVFAEPDTADPAADAALIEAIRAAGNVVLPVYRHSVLAEEGQLLPFPGVRDAVAGLGHSHLSPDRDGRLRQFRLELAGQPAFPVALLSVAGIAVPALPATARLPIDVGSLRPVTLSAASLLRAQEPPHQLRGQLVLVGVTAPGVAPHVLFPGASAAVPAILAHAGALSALQSGLVLRDLDPEWAAALIAVLAGVAAPVCVGRRPRLAELLALAVLAMSLPIVVPLLTGLVPVTAAAIVAASAGMAIRATASWLHERRHLLLEQRRADVTLHSIADAVLSADADARLDYVNPAAERLLDLPRGEIVGRPIGEVVRLVTGEAGAPLSLLELAQRPKRSPDAARDLLLSTAGGQRPVRCTVSPIGRPGDRLGFVMALSDITAERALVDELARRATHDALTGLPNRYLLRDRLAGAIARARRDGAQAAVVLLDLDRFKSVNDALGHAAGDRLLVEVARRLRAAARETDTVGRLGGDEFLMLLHVGEGLHGVLSSTRRFQDTLRQPFELEGQIIHVGASVGVSLAPDNGTDPDQLVKCADLALYRAKQSQRGGIVFFSEEMNARAMDRLALDRELRAAIAQDELELHYQPQVALDDDRVVGVECLVRWRHPDRGLVPPGSFVPLAEETGIICDLGRFVLQGACRQLDGWRHRDPGLRLAVNLSVMQLKLDDGFTSFVDATLRACHLAPERLELEVTESLFLDPDLRQLRSRIGELVELGIKLSIDDFGTGYSSLAYLKRFPFDRIKIDRSFVQDVESDPQARAIVGAIVGLGHSLGKPVIAEGVETPAQLDFLRALHCDEAQGYLLGRPAVATAIDPMIGR